MVDRERQVGRGRLADRLAVVPGFGQREQIEVLLHAVGDLVENQRAFGDAGAAPGLLGGVRGVERVLRCPARSERAISQSSWPFTGEKFSK